MHLIPILFLLFLRQIEYRHIAFHPGEYKILYINFFYDEYLDQSDSLKFSRFEVHKNAITYIGTFHSEYKWNLTQGVKPIPTMIVRRKNMSGQVSLCLA